MEDSKKKVIRIVSVCIILVSIFYILQIVLRKPAIDVSMVQAANEINKNCPIMVDSITRFDNAMALSNNKFQFNFTILNVEKSTFDTVELQKKIRPIALNSLKTDPKYKIYREKNMTLLFNYHDKSGSYLCKILVLPDEYTN